MGGVTASHGFHSAPFLLHQSNTSLPQSNKAPEEAKVKEKDFVSVMLSSFEDNYLLHLAGKTIAAEAIPVN